MTNSSSTTEAQHAKHAAAAAAALQVPRPEGGRSGTQAIDEAHERLIQLPVTDINLSEFNPRKKRNSAFQELKDSIRENGFRGNLIVSKINGKYTLIFGGNTRLEVLKELYAEGNKQFEYVSAHYTPHSGDEFSQFAANYTENATRADICFWDKVTTIMQMLSLCTQEAGKKISTQNFLKKIKEAGVSNVSEAFVSYCRFSIIYLENWPHKERELTLNAAITLSQFRSVATTPIPDHIKQRITGDVNMEEIIKQGIETGAKSVLAKNPTMTAADIASNVVANMPNLVTSVLKDRVQKSKKITVLQYFSNLLQKKESKNSATEKKPSRQQKTFSTAVEKTKDDIKTLDSLFSTAVEKHKIVIEIFRNDKYNNFFVVPQKLTPETDQYILWWMLADFSGQFSQSLLDENHPQISDFYAKIADEADEAELLELLGGQPQWFGLLNSTASRHLIKALATWTWEK